MRNRRITAILAALVLLLLASGCNYKKLKEIRATSWSLESVALRGLRSLQANLALELENPSMKVTLKDITGVLYYNGEPFIHYTMDPITLSAKSTKTYHCSCILELDPSKSIMDVLASLPGLSSENMTTDISAKAKVKGISKSFAFKSVPVKRFMKK
ncbi:MAG: LEA type 2 family protein [Bacteroidales bacterium]|nr:LEA type 2 family protein [Bacteroidales bacterium]